MPNNPWTSSPPPWTTTDNPRQNRRGQAAGYPHRPNARVSGKRTRNRPRSAFLYRSIPGAEQPMDLFTAAVDYYK